MYVPRELFTYCRLAHTTENTMQIKAVLFLAFTAVGLAAPVGQQKPGFCEDMSCWNRLNNTDIPQTSTASLPAMVKLLRLRSVMRRTSGTFT